MKTPKIVHFCFGTSEINMQLNTYRSDHNSSIIKRQCYNDVKFIWNKKIGSYFALWVNKRQKCLKSWFIRAGSSLFGKPTKSISKASSLLNYWLCSSVLMPYNK